MLALNRIKGNRYMDYNYNHNGVEGKLTDIPYLHRLAAIIYFSLSEIVIQM